MYYCTQQLNPRAVQWLMSPDSETVELSLLCDILALYANANTRLNPNTSRRIFSVTDYSSHDALWDVLELWITWSGWYKVPSCRASAGKTFRILMHCTACELVLRLFLFVLQHMLQQATCYIDNWYEAFSHWCVLFLSQCDKMSANTLMFLNKKRHIVLFIHL